METPVNNSSPADAGASGHAPPDESNAAEAHFSTPFDGEIRRRFDLAKEARKQEIEKKLLEDARRRDGEYEPDVLEKLEMFGGSKTFDNITDPKCAGIESMLADMLVYTNDRIWGLLPTPIPELDGQVQAQAEREVVLAAMEQGIDPASSEYDEDFAAAAEDLKKQIKAAIEKEAKGRAERMERKISDQLAEGKFEEALNDFITDLATHQIAAMMGPCPQIEMVPAVRGTEVSFEERLVLGVERVSPFHVYPESLSTKPGDGDFFIRKPITDDAAKALRKIPAVKAARLAAALKRPSTGTEDVDLQLETIQQGTSGGNSQKPKEDHELVYWWHRATQKEIDEFEGKGTEQAESGEEGELSGADVEEDVGELIPMMGLMLNGIVIKAVPNWDKTGKPQVFVTSFRKRPGAFWGKGGAALAKGPQEQANTAARALQNNINMSAQARTVSDSTLLVDPRALDRSFPGQNISIHNRNPGDSRKAVEILETPNYTLPLLQARNAIATTLDEKSGVFPQSYGSPAQTGPAKTLGGYQLLRKDQTTTMKRTIANISQEVIGPLVKAFWLWNMLFDDDMSIKGDFHVVARGPVQSFLATEEAETILAAMELFTTNPQVQAISKPLAIATLARRLLKLNRINPGDLLKDESEIFGEIEAAKAAQADAQRNGEGNEPPPPETSEARPDSESAKIRAQADLMRANVSAEKLALDRERFAAERAERLARIQKMQRDIARENSARAGAAGGIDFGVREYPANGAAA
jgi:hypothetical protein